MTKHSTSSIIIGTAFSMVVLGSIGGFGLHYLQGQQISENELRSVKNQLSSRNILDMIFKGASKPTTASANGLDEIIIPGQRRGDSLFVTVELNDYKEVTLLVDTGATDITLTSDVAFDLGLLQSESDEAFYDTANGKAKVYVSELDTVRVGDAVQHHVRTSFGEGIAGFDGGLLGMSFFKHYIVNVDLEREELHLRPRT